MQKLGSLLCCRIYGVPQIIGRRDLPGSAQSRACKNLRKTFVSRPVFFFAGIWRSWSGPRGTKRNPAEGEHLLFSFLTTAPNAEVAPVHSKATPVLLLDEAARETWLTAPVEEALKLQRPAPDGTLKIVAVGPKEDVLLTA
jgi:putative SOS response-associated peptidase YedK